MLLLLWKDYSWWLSSQWPAGNWEVEASYINWEARYLQATYIEIQEKLYKSNSNTYMNQWLYYNWGLHVFYVFIVFVLSLHVDPVSPVNGAHRHSSLSLQIHTISMQGLYYWPVSSSKLEADNSQLACVDSFMFMNIDKIHYVSIF